MQSDQVMERVIQIDREKCTGCGSCIETCPCGAIHLVDHQAEIDDDLCTRCEACLDACANSAITAVSVPAYTKSIITRPVTDSEIDGHQPSINVPGSITPRRELMPLVDVVLTFLGNEVAPRIIDLVFNSLENRLTRRKEVMVSASKSSSSTYPQRRAQQKHIRHRGGNMKSRQHKGRR
jgi:NAD-dependent dihydropyrimidine dehydrogenase PreA subunit